MNYRSLIIILFLLCSCTGNIQFKNPSIKEKKTKFINSGFTLVYNDNLYLNKIVNKKMNERDLIIFQKNLIYGTPVKLINPYNNKSLIAKVGKNSIYPVFNNSVITKRIASELELALDEPYLLIEEIIHNNAFIAKKTKTFDEEKQVANKAPVEKITVNDLNEKPKVKNKNIDRKFNYSIKIADFYFEDSAKMMMNRIINESSIEIINIQQISKNKFRVIMGPYFDLKSLQKEYNKLNKFNFENIEIINNV